MAAGDLWAVTCYFNSAQYKTKRRNYERFVAGLEQNGVPCLVVDCAFGDAPFALAPSPRVMQIRASHVMWQKERLLNLAIRSLPAACTKVAWLDCDILFGDDDWAARTSALLEEYAVVQPFSRVIRLPKGYDAYEGEGEEYRSFGRVYMENPKLLYRGRFDQHGHTGFAWAARRALLEKHGLYDACISGSGDHMMAHAFCGDWDSDCLDRILGANGRHRQHFERWAEAMYADAQGRVGGVDGALLHLWHGEMDKRRYVQRNQELAQFAFDPETDVKIGANGCWEWNSDKRPLHAWAIAYYAKRREDGDLMPPVGAESANREGANREGDTTPDVLAAPIAALPPRDARAYIAELEAALGRAHLEIERLRRSNNQQTTNDN